METITKEPVKETFEVNNEPVNTTVSLPTREEAKAQGLTADEMDRAEKKGLIAKPEDAAAKARADADAKAKADAEAKAKEESDQVTDGDKGEDDKPKSSIPDFTFKTPEQEKAFLDAFGPGTPQRAMYFRMKNERSARQAEKLAREAAEKRAADLEAENKALKAGKPTQEVDELGNPIDPEDKPLTLKQLRELQKKEADEMEAKRKENESRARVVAEAQQTQEEYMQSLHPDFDDTVNLVKDLIPNLEKLVPERWKQTKILNKVRELQIAAAQADKIDLDEYHAAQIAYEIGQMHPNYGKKADDTQDGDPSENGKPKDPKKANGGLTPEQLKRIEENNRRKPSSASIPGGGGKRTISADDVDAAALDKMSYAERQKFREKHPDRYARLLRG